MEGYGGLWFPRDGDGGLVCVGGEGGETKLVVSLTFVPDPDPKRDPVTARPEAENVRRHHISSI